jgi:hypothetical protein
VNGFEARPPRDVTRRDATGLDRRLLMGAGRKAFDEQIYIYRERESGIDI